MDVGKLKKLFKAGRFSHPFIRANSVQMNSAPAKLPRKTESISSTSDNARNSSDSSSHGKTSVPAVSFEKSTDETERLRQDSTSKSWKTWGPYLSERQWGTVREDYSHDGNWSVMFSNVSLLTQVV